MTRLARLKPNFPLNVLFAPSAATKIFVRRVNYAFDRLPIPRHNPALTRRPKKKVVELLSSYNAKMDGLLERQAPCRKDELGRVNGDCGQVVVNAKLLQHRLGVGAYAPRAKLRPREDRLVE
jgi:hypothetical protein